MFLHSLTPFAILVQRLLIHVTKRVKLTGQFVPLRLALKIFFELPGALAETLKYVQSLKNSADNCLSNVIQGSLWQRKLTLFEDDDIVLPLILYYDEVECNAALGPHSEKLGQVT